MYMDNNEQVPFNFSVARRMSLGAYFWGVSLVFLFVFLLFMSVSFVALKDKTLWEEFGPDI